MENLDTIDLSNSNNSRHRSDVGRGIEKILNATHELSIASINISINIQGDDGFKYLKEFFEQTPTLKALKAASCELESASCPIFEKAIRVGKPKMREIDLDSNKISGLGFKALFVGLESMKSIEIVNVSNNITEHDDDCL